MLHSARNILAGGLNDQPFVGVASSMGVNLMSSGVLTTPTRKLSSSMTVGDMRRTSGRLEPPRELGASLRAMQTGGDLATKLGVRDFSPEQSARSSTGLPCKFTSRSGLTGPSPSLVKREGLQMFDEQTSAAQVQGLETFKCSDFFKVDKEPLTTRNPHTLDVRRLVEQKPEEREPVKFEYGPNLRDPNYLAKYRDKYVAPTENLRVSRKSARTKPMSEEKRRKKAELADNMALERKPAPTTAHTFMFHTSNVSKDITQHRRDLENLTFHKDPIDLHISTFKRTGEMLPHYEGEDPSTYSTSLMPASKHPSLAASLSTTLRRIGK
ncbi:hypothetical protein GMRT_11139 [Giardia muris]|uniref:Uncharacterized protein n=1 Tax=Giardia muris TaxID=5742 RepID=A0A4Z1T0Y9_GIAMU|nr:hypothetical protein GMRT_11139 [Giardia muris]|eukprot:TNJ29368.1 hypothetical protein GMRT_11139 [Giardia muris]